MKLVTTAPAGWDQRIAFPLQSIGYAQAAAALGYRPLFADDDHGLALVLVRLVPVPLLARWTARAKVYAHVRDATFWPSLVERLQPLGVSHVSLGDAMWGGAAGLCPSAGTPSTDLSLAAQTAVRMRGRGLAAVYPTAYFEAVLREMVSRGQAVLFIARAAGTPVAGGAFVMSRERFVYLHGCSTRDRALTPKDGPTAVFWHAIRFARTAGCAVFDMGAVTPTDDPTHRHYSVYAYKKGWSGQLEEIQSGKLVVAPWKHRFQESVLAPMWDRVHPLYLRWFDTRARNVVADVA